MATVLGSTRRFAHSTDRISSVTICSRTQAPRARLVCLLKSPCPGRLTTAASSRKEETHHAEDADGRDRCDLVDAFSRAAIKQQGRPREDVRSYIEPPAAGRSNTTARHVFPSWVPEPMQSMDSHEIVDWSDLENDGWGANTAEQTGSDSSCDNTTNSNSNHNSSSSGGAGGGGHNSSSRRDSSSLPPAAAAASRAFSGLHSIAGTSSSFTTSLAWGGSVHPHARCCSRRVTVYATPSGSKQSTEADDAPHYDGADSENLFPPGSLEMDDPGHPSELAGVKDMQAAVERPQPKPYMNIKNGRWVPPSKSEAEEMMGMLSTMGPDEGV